MKVVLVCEEQSLVQALKLHLVSRGRELHWESLDSLRARPSLLDDALLIDGLSLNLADDGVAARQKSFDSLLALSRQRARVYIALSDARVFDGLAEGDTPLNENTTPESVGKVGKALLAMEEALLSCSLQSLVLRTGPIIAATGDNFLTDFVRALKRGESPVISNQTISSPTAVSDLARVLCAMLEQLNCGANCRGIYHYQSSGPCSAYEFAEVAYAHASQYLPQVNQIDVGEGGMNWSPLLAELRCERVLRNFGIKQLPWRAWLPKLIKTICEEDDNDSG